MSPNCIVMPDKEGSEDEKTTKGVVKKKQKQILNQEYIPEEEYDRYKDRMAMAGREIRSKDTKDASSYPQSRKKSKGDTPVQKEFKKKYGKKATALDAVKADITAKYGKGAIMDVGKKNKKKANVQDEFDLTKIAEAFGGYIVEAEKGEGIRKIGGKTYIYPSKGEKEKEKKILSKFKKKGDETQSNIDKPMDKPSKNIDDFIAADDPFNVKSREDAAQAEKDAAKDIEIGGGTDPRFKKSSEGQFSKGGKFKKSVSGTPQAKDYKPKAGTQKLGDTTIGGEVKTTIDPSVIDPKFKKKSPPKFTPDEIRASQDILKQQKGKDRIIDVDAGETTGELERTAQTPIEKPKPKRKRGRPAKKASPAELAQIQKDIEKSKADPENRVVPSPVKTMGKDGVMRNRPLPATGSQMTDYYKASDDYKIRVKGINPKTGQAFNMNDPNDYDEYMKAIGSSKRAMDNPKFKDRFEKGDLMKQQQADTKFASDRPGSLTLRAPKPKTTFGKNFTDMMTNMQTAQQSFVGALGGVFAKGLSPATAGAEAGLKYSRGDKTGAALSAIQGLGGGIGFSAGVINALRMMNPKSSAQLSLKKGDPEKEAMASAAGAGFVTQARDTLRRLPKGAPGLKGGKAGLRRARGGGGL